MSPVFTTGNPTLAELRAAVATRGYDTTEAVLDDAINDAYREVIAARRWPFLSTDSTSLEIPAAADSVSLGGITDLLHVEAVRTADTDLEWWPLTKFRQVTKEDSTTGSPAAWCRHGVDLLIWPTVDAAHVLEIDYAAAVPELIDADDEIAFPATYRNAIVWGAVVTLAFRQRELNTANTAERRRDAAVAAMARAYGLEHRHGGRTVIESGFYD